MKKRKMRNANGWTTIMVWKSQHRRLKTLALRKDKTMRQLMEDMISRAEHPRML